MNNMDYPSDNSSKDLSKADSLTMQQVEAMRLVARMREAADKCGAGFVGGFITPTGERFMSSNIDESDPQYAAINQQLNDIQQQRIQQNQMNESIKKMDDHQRNVLRILSEFEGMSES